MESLIHYFNTIPSSHRALILAGGITFFWLLEGVIPLVRFSYAKWRHALLNLFFTLTTIVVNFGFALLIVKAADYSTAHKTGLLNLVEMPVWLYTLFGLLLLDFIGAYLVHWVQHKTPWMWRFHMIHHADEYVDTTTANRHHPGESVFRAAFTLLAVIVAGSPIWLVMAYQSLSVVLSQFNHANIHLPGWMDKGIRLLIVSPDMHKVHHHFEQPATDTNYGNIFSIWDRLFGTYLSPRKAGRLQYGLDLLDGHPVQSLKHQMKLPFGKMPQKPVKAS